jgi:hypothetical protein
MTTPRGFSLLVACIALGLGVGSIPATSGGCGTECRSTRADEEPTVRGSLRIKGEDGVERTGTVDSPLRERSSSLEFPFVASFRPQLDDGTTLDLELRLSRVPAVGTHALETVDARICVAGAAKDCEQLTGEIRVTEKSEQCDEPDWHGHEACAKRLAFEVVADQGPRFGGTIKVRIAESTHEIDCGGGCGQGG